MSDDEEKAREEEAREQEAFENSPEFRERERARKDEENRKQLENFAEFAEKEESESQEDYKARKLALLAKLEAQVDAQKVDDELESKAKQAILEKQQLIVDKQAKLSEFWFNVLAVDRWEKILREYFLTLHGMIRGMCDKTVLTVTVKDGIMHLEWEYFDKDGKSVITEFNMHPNGEPS